MVIMIPSNHLLNEKVPCNFFTKIKSSTFVSHKVGKLNSKLWAKNRQNTSLLQEVLLPR